MLVIQASAFLRVYDRSLYQRAVVRINAFQYQVDRWRNGRCVTKDPKLLIRPNQFSGGQIPAETAGMTELLRLLEIGLPPSQFLSQDLVLGDVQGTADVLFQLLVLDNRST